MSFKMYFMLFIVYAFIGWIVEVVGFYIQDKKIYNRGFLIGPYCPIYGFGGVLIVLLLTRYLSDMLTLTVMAIFICGVLEYTTSFVMEKIFHVRWWDYTNYKFNINGRICLETLLGFGILACFAMYILNPPLIGFFESLPETVFNIIFYVIIVIFSLDIIISCIIISGVKVTVKNVRKDSTEEMSNYVKNELRKKSFLSKRLVNAFPNFQAMIKKVGSGIKKGIKKTINKGKKS